MEETLWWSTFGMCLVRERSRKKRKSKRKWSRDWLMKKQVFSHITLLDTLRDEPNDWRNYLRMGEDTYMELLNLVSPLIRKQDTVMRKSISPHEKLTATLRFLATGRSLSLSLRTHEVFASPSLCIKFIFRISSCAPGLHTSAVNLKMS